MKFRVFSTAALVLAAISAPIAAQQANTEAASALAGTYGIEPSHTRVLFSVNHFGFNNYYGEFPGASGTLSLDPRNPAASRIDVSVPVATVTTTNATLDGELKGADWFDAAKYPTIRFVSTKVTPTGANTAKIAGNLTLHGVTKPVVLDATLKGSGPNPLNKAYTVGFQISGQIKRSDFGVSKYVPLVGDEVDLIISAAFEKKPA